MPKVVVYVRAEDARVIESVEGHDIELWVRSVVRDEISHWHARRSGHTLNQQMPEPWRNRQEQLKEES
jgi:predicted RNase H-like nuclease (RuvC/YqgF family)